MKSPIITLLTDFGLKDGYVAGMKGAILSLCPEARLVDISHLIPPRDIRSGAYLLGTVYRDFPEGSIHLAVVDPGVGTKRRALGMKAGGYLFVGPDNGLFSWILKRESTREAHILENPLYQRLTVSSTFHGRDIFAPAAAHLASGIPLDRFGPACDPLSVPWSSISVSDGALRGEVIYVDHFGNVITNLSRDDLEAFAPREQWAVRVRDITIPVVVDTYGEEPPGITLALIGSSGHLEIAVNRGNAADALLLQPGEQVLVFRVYSERTLAELSSPRRRRGRKENAEEL